MVFLQHYLIFTIVQRDRDLLFSISFVVSLLTSLKSLKLHWNHGRQQVCVTSGHSPPREKRQESRAISGRTAQCRCKCRYIRVQFYTPAKTDANPFPPEFGGVPVGPGRWCWGSEEGESRLTSREIIFEVFQPGWSAYHVPERHRQADRRRQPATEDQAVFGSHFTDISWNFN